MESEQSKNFFEKSYDGTVSYLQRNPRRSAVIAGSVLLFVLGFFIPVAQPHVSLSGEPILAGGPGWLTNSMITTLLVDIVIIILALLATVNMKEIPGRWQNLMEAMVEYLYDLAEGVAGRDARRFFPWVATIFLLVIVSNWSGLIPGVSSVGFYHQAGAGEHARAGGAQLAMADGKLVLLDAAAVDARDAAAEEEGHAKFVPLLRAPSADLNLTFALAITTMVMVQVWGFQAFGLGHLKKYFTFRGKGGMRFINAFVGILELISEFSRVIAFGFRLFGNIFAGEIVLATMAFLITFWLPIPFYMLEIFVGFVQALVFMMLALVFFSMATSQEH